MRVEDERLLAAHLEEEDAAVVEAEHDDVGARRVAAQHCRLCLHLIDSDVRQTLRRQVHDLEQTCAWKINQRVMIVLKLTVRLDDEEKVGVALAPLAMDHVRLQLSLELDALRLDVPDQQDLIVSGLGNRVRVGLAPADRRDVTISERQQLR